MMTRATLPPRQWLLLTIIPVGVAALLAFSSGDILLILAVLTGVAGLALLAYPAPARPAGIASRPASRRDTAAGTKAA